VVLVNTGSYSSPKLGVRTLRERTPRMARPSIGSQIRPAFQASVAPTVV
jgi:hypothetical protein